MKSTSHLFLILSTLLLGCGRNLNEKLVKNWIVPNEGFQLLIKANGNYYCAQNYSWQKGTWKVSPKEDSILFFPIKSMGYFKETKNNESFGAEIEKVESEELVLVIKHERLVFKKKDKQIPKK